ncbi:MAG: hypothetical protein AAFO73_03845 [Pseudomonadota bacterium]
MIDKQVERRIWGTLAKTPTTLFVRVLSLIPIFAIAPMSALGLVVYLHYRGKTLPTERRSFEWSVLIAVLNIILSIYILQMVGTFAFETITNLWKMLYFPNLRAGGTNGSSGLDI